jgi:hypothetical protein
MRFWRPTTCGWFGFTEASDEPDSRALADTCDDKPPTPEVFRVTIETPFTHLSAARAAADRGGSSDLPGRALTITIPPQPRFA